MGYVSRIEDQQSGATLLSLVGPTGRPIMPQGNMGWQSRGATFTTAWVDFGASPFGNFATPLAPRRWPWQVRAIGYMGWDAALDALNAAVGHRRPVRLVYAHDAGYERVCDNAVAMSVDAPFGQGSDFYSDLKVEWELNSFWTERRSVDNTIRMGQGILMGQGHTMGEGGSTLSITSSVFNIPTSALDASVAGPGGVPNQADSGPVITITGPFGGALGFSLSALTDPFGAYFNFSGSVLEGWQLIIDCGAWSATYHSGTTTVDRTDLLSVPDTQPYVLAVQPKIANQWQLATQGATPLRLGTVSTTTTDVPLPSTSTLMHVVSTAGFYSSGSLLVENEIIHYTGMDATTFTGLTRGASGTTAAVHNAVSPVTQVNPPYGASSTVNIDWRRYFL